VHIRATKEAQATTDRYETTVLGRSNIRLVARVARDEYTKQDA
jgi:hypothetical protein